MLQVFHLDVAKVDRNIAHVAVAIHVCFKCMFQIFHLVFLDVCLQSVLSRCCICFHIYEVFSGAFLQVFHRNVSSVSSISCVCCKCFI